MIEDFIPTLLGAFAGVTGSFLVERWAQFRNYKRLLDALYIRCDHYVSALRARFQAIEQEMLKPGVASDTQAVKNLLRANIDPPETFSNLLASSYGKYLRAKDIAALSLCESNMEVLYRDLMGDNASLERAQSRISVLKEEAARRCWIIYSSAWKLDDPFSGVNYSALVESLNESDEGRISKLKAKHVLSKAQQSHSAEARTSRG